MNLIELTKYEYLALFSTIVWIPLSLILLWVYNKYYK